MKKLSYLICIYFFCNQALSAQTFPSFYQYGPFQGYANPAIPFKGYNGHHNLSVQASHRSQSLNGLQDVPFNQVLQLDWMPQKGVQFKPYLGAGITKRQFGPTRFTNLFLKLGAINFTSVELGMLSAAINVGFNQFGLKASETNGLAPSDPLLNADYSESIPNIGLGIYYESPTLSNKYKLYFGLSVPQVFAMDLAVYSVKDELTRITQPIYNSVIGTKIYTGAFNYFDFSTWITREEELGVYGNLLVRYHIQQPAAMWFGGGISSTENYRIEWGIHLNYLRTTNSRLHQNKGTYLRLNIAYNFSSNAVPSQLNHGVELNLAWVLVGR